MQVKLNEMQKKIPSYKNIAESSDKFTTLFSGV